MMLPDIQKVIAIIENTAKQYICPRFQNLSPSEVHVKTSGDLVSIADIEAEKYLKKKLSELVPNSYIVGEEEVEYFPENLKYLQSTDPVWILDPLDGTRNFINGKKPFTIIIAFCVGKKTQMGCIHDPITNETVWAVKGQGCWSGQKCIKLDKFSSFEYMKGYLSKYQTTNNKVLDNLSLSIRRVGSIGREYLDLALGNIQFASFDTTLKPWDHAAGVLIHTESGGYNRLGKSDNIYHPKLKFNQTKTSNDTLILAPNKKTFNAIYSVLQKKES